MAAAVLQVSTLVVACGGTVRKDGDEAEPVDPGEKDPETDPPASGGGGSGDPGAPEVDLPECKKGVEQSEAESCVFLYEGRCYEEKLAACACACKRRTGTTCSSGFPGGSEPTKVTCF